MSRKNTKKLCAAAFLSVILAAGVSFAIFRAVDGSFLFQRDTAAEARAPDVVEDKNQEVAPILESFIETTRLEIFGADGRLENAPYIHKTGSSDWRRPAYYLSLAAGEMRNLKAEVDKGNKFVWESSDTSVVSVEEGSFKALSDGTATVKVYVKDSVFLPENPVAGRFDAEPLVFAEVHVEVGRRTYDVSFDRADRGFVRTVEGGFFSLTTTPEISEKISLKTSFGDGRLADIGGGDFHFFLGLDETDVDVYYDGEIRHTYTFGTDRSERTFFWLGYVDLENRPTHAHIFVDSGVPFELPRAASVFSDKEIPFPHLTKRSIGHVAQPVFGDVFRSLDDDGRTYVTERRSPVYETWLLKTAPEGETRGPLIFLTLRPSMPRAEAPETPETKHGVENGDGKKKSEETVSKNLTERLRQLKEKMQNAANRK